MNILYTATRPQRATQGWKHRLKLTAAIIVIRQTPCHLSCESVKCVWRSCVPASLCPNRFFCWIYFLRLEQLNTFVYTTSISGSSHFQLGLPIFLNIWGKTIYVRLCASAIYIIKIFNSIGYFWIGLTFLSCWKQQYQFWFKKIVKNLCLQLTVST